MNVCEYFFVKLRIAKQRRMWYNLLTMNPLPVIPRVAIIGNIALSGDRLFSQGVGDYSHKFGPWRIFYREGRQIEQPHERPLTDNDGVIIDTVDRRPLKALMRTGVKIVVVDSRDSPERSVTTMPEIPRLHYDSSGVGKTAAQFFLDRKYQNFAYICDVFSHPWSTSRGRAFAMEVKSMGYKCSIYPAPNAAEQANAQNELPRLKRFLTGLPKPVAVLAAMDSRARQVLEACCDCKLNVPDDISILGVDNDELICHTSYPELSSVAYDSYQAGWMAAKALDALLHGKKPPDDVFRLPSTWVVERRSTGYPCMSNPIIGKAIGLIRTHALVRGLTAQAIVGELHCSRRYLEIQFAKSLGITIKEAILRERFSIVKQKIKEKVPLDEVALGCGFSDQSHLSSVFRKRYGQTISAWRQQHTIPT